MSEKDAIKVIQEITNAGDREFVIGVDNRALVAQIKNNRLLLWRAEYPKASGGDWRKSSPILDGFNHLVTLGRNGSNIFLHPNLLQGGMSDRHATEYNSVFFEIDPPKGANIKDSLVTNRNRLNQIQDRGLVFSVQVYSGNKSDHNYFRLSEPIDLPRWLNLQRKAAIAFGGDPAIVTASRKMRFPLVYRKVGGAVRLCKCKINDVAYNPKDLEKWLDTLIGERYSVAPPDYISKERFREYKRLDRRGLPVEDVADLLNKSEAELETSYENIDLSDIPADLIQPIALKAIKSIPESVPGEGNYEDLYRRLCGGCKRIFGDERATEIMSAHSPLRDASATIRSITAYNVASLFKVAREYGGWEWEREDAKKLQDFFHEDILRSYAQHKGRVLSVKLSPLRKKFQLLGCPDNYWKEECNIIAATLDVRPVYGASEEWWELYQKKRVGLGSDWGEGTYSNDPDWVRENQIKPWLNRLKDQGDRLLSHESAIDNRFIVAPEELPDHDGTQYKVLFDDEKDRYELVKGSKARGYKIVVDISPTGTGKTHHLQNFGKDSSKVVLMLPSHRNPHVPDLRDIYFEMPTRHNGMFFHSDGKYRRFPEAEGQPPQIYSNCHKAQEFIDGINSGRNLEINSPCSTCDYVDSCGKDQQNRPDGSGFLRHRYHALSKTKIRAHISQFDGLPDHFFKDRLVVVDEAMTQLSGFKTETLNINNAFESLRFLERLHPGKAQIYTPILNHLEKLAEGSVSPFGVSHEEIMEDAPPAPTWDDKAWLKGVMTARIDGAINWDYAVNTEFAEQAGQQTPYEPLSDLVKVWCGDRGSISVKGEVITVTMPDFRSLRTVEKFHGALLMDATPNIQLLAHLFNCEESEILVITRDTPDNSRLGVTVIETPGTKSRQNLNESNQVQFRVGGLIGEIKKHDPNARVIGLKNCPIPHDGYWGNHSRGDNSNSGVSTLISYGLPFPNLGACQDQYRALTGTLDGFQEYYEHLVAAEIIQLAGRQRAHRFNKDFQLFMICSGLDPRFLKHLGCKVNSIHATQINPRFGTESQYKRFILAQTAKEMAATGSQLTQAALAKALGVTQQAVSQMTKEFADGWKGFRASIQGALIKPLKDALYFSPNAASLSDWQGFTPITAAQLVAPILELKDHADIKALLDGTSPQAVPWLLAIALNLFVLEDEKPPK